MAGPGYLVSYPKDFFPALVAEGFIQRVQFRLKHDKLRLSNNTLRRMFGKMCVDEKARALSMLKEMPLLQFAYTVLRNKTKQKKMYWTNNKPYIEALVDKATGIPYGNLSFLDISFIKDMNNNLFLRIQVFRGSGDKLFPTRFVVTVPAYLETDIRNALARLSSRHKASLAATRDKAAKKYSTDKHARKGKNGQTKHGEDNAATQDTSENKI